MFGEGGGRAYPVLVQLGDRGGRKEWGEGAGIPLSLSSSGVGRGYPCPNPSSVLLGVLSPRKGPGTRDWYPLPL